MTVVGVGPLLWLYNVSVVNVPPLMVTDPLPLIELDQVDSTNSWLLSQSRLGQIEWPVAVIARVQTGGRGRLGRKWVARPDASLCLSVGMQLKKVPPSWISLAVGVSVINWLIGRGVTQVGLKWPNDVMVGALKLGGILCESSCLNGGSLLVVGLGLNVEPIDSENPSVSLRDLGLQVGPDQISEIGRSIGECLLLDLNEALTNGFAQVATQFRTHDVFLGQQVKVVEQGQELYRGKAVGIAEEGAYLIETQKGLVSIQSGDLSLRQVRDE